MDMYGVFEYLLELLVMQHAISMTQWLIFGGYLGFKGIPCTERSSISHLSRVSAGESSTQKRLVWDGM